MKELTFTKLRELNKKRNQEFLQRVKAGEKWNIVDRSNELAGEVGELCNMTKKIRRYNMGMLPATSAPHLKELKKEIADIQICLDLLAMDLGIDINEVVPWKFNKSSDKFGLKTKFPESPGPTKKFP